MVNQPVGQHLPVPGVRRTRNNDRLAAPTGIGVVRRGRGKLRTDRTGGAIHACAGGAGCIGLAAGSRRHRLSHWSDGRRAPAALSGNISCAIASPASSAHSQSASANASDRVTRLQRERRTMASANRQKSVDDGRETRLGDGAPILHSSVQMGPEKLADVSRRGQRRYAAAMPLHQHRQKWACIDAAFALRLQSTPRDSIVQNARCGCCHASNCGMATWAIACHRRLP